ncbi:S66 peptidase family protein [Clostridium formicaceticum]|uniref:LD-carboxypeptidase n=1 Tax=Clostridium formicaceticum TaxID=1497 RepID=A0AAC9RT19_9CLOT|nr:LD-carboxypeptidase [Clostridium formicaceticum]AOY75045.1 LD-carboxypeptidase [Clostridium formicaceticum]ARE89465.1 putative murein peptide carboxypeptidase [Clostridium formicaceticum]
MIKPKALELGDTIGIIAPASPSTKKKIDLAKEKLNALGYKVRVGKSCYAAHGYLAGKDDLRAEDVNHMFEDEMIKGIICLRGGYGATKILDKLDFKAIENNPKVFVGYSDITALHLAINQKCHLVTFHGPMAASDFAGDMEDFTRVSFLKAVTTSHPMEDTENPVSEKLKCLVEGEATGKIIGGNLSLIAATMGTPYEIDTKGKLLFLEDIGEAPYRIDRMLTQLALAGKFHDAVGIILGDFKDCEASQEEKSLDLMEVFKEIILPYGKPTVYNLKAGHCSPMLTLPFGVNTILKATETKLYIEEVATVR